MTSWTDAFGKAIKVFILSVVWVIVGIIVMAVGYYVGWPSDYYSDPNWLIIYAGILIGTILMVFGGIASIFKVVGDMLEESRGHQYTG